jgi:hypothetical protein
MCKAKQVATLKDVEAKIKTCLLNGQVIIRDSRGETVQLESHQTGIFEVVPNLADLERGHYDFRISHARVCKMVNEDGIISRMATLNGSFKLSFDDSSNIVVNIESATVLEYLN